MPDVSTEHPDYTYMRMHHELPETLMEGTVGMRAAGERYLPKHQKEKRHHYDERLKSSVLWGFFEDGIESLSAKPFSQPVVITDDSHPIAKEWGDDIDNQGGTLTGFSRRLFECAAITGIAHILVEFPQSGAPLQSIAEREVSRVRPWWVLVKPGDLTAWRKLDVNGRPTLTRITLREQIVEEDGEWGYRQIEQWRVIETDPMPRWQIWRRTAEDAKTGGGPTLHEEGVYGSNTIKLVTVYFRRQRFMVGLPPLERLAFLELAHWQSNSDQTIALMMHRFPIVLAAGIEPGAGQPEIEWSPRTIIGTREPGGRLSFAEHGGTAIESGRQGLTDLVDRMKSITASTLSNRPGDVKATAIAIDTASVKTVVEAWARAVEAAIEQAFMLSFEWMGIRNAKIDCTVNAEFSLPGEGSDIELLQKQALAGQLSRRTLLEEEIRRGVLDERRNVDEELERIDEDMLLAGPPPPESSDGMGIDTDIEPDAVAAE